MKNLIALTVVTFLMSFFSFQKTSAEVQSLASSMTVAPDVKPVTVRAEIKSGGEIRCNLARDERILMLMVEKPGCELIYTKFAEDRSVAQSKLGSRYCVQVRRQIRKSLEDAGYKCK